MQRRRRGETGWPVAPVVWYGVMGEEEIEKKERMKNKEINFSFIFDLLLWGNTVFYNLGDDVWEKMVQWETSKNNNNNNNSNNFNFFSRKRKMKRKIFKKKSGENMGTFLFFLLHMLLILYRLIRNNT